MSERERTEADLIAELKARLSKAEVQYSALYGRYVDRRTVAWDWEQRYWELLGVDMASLL